MARLEPTLDHEAALADQVYGVRRGRHSYNDDDGPDFDTDDADESVFSALWATPARIALSLTFVLGFAVVALNAAYLQPGAHPAPMMATRDGAPAMALPWMDDRLPGRTITSAPSPLIPPSGRFDATASIGTPTSGGADAIASLLARAPYRAPSPVARPLRPGDPFASPVAVQPVARPVSTIAVNDPIGALLAPVVASQPSLPSGQAGAPGAATRSAQPLVAAVQSVLADMGYNPGSIDGLIGPSTEEAIRRFQLRRALEPNGQITTDLLREIERVTGTRITAS